MKNSICPRIKSTSLTFRIVNMIYVLGPQNRAQINEEMGVQPYITASAWSRAKERSIQVHRVNGVNNCQLAHLRRIGVLKYSEKTRLWSLGPNAKKMMKQHPELWGDID
jgi:hypothetical protein